MKPVLQALVIAERVYEDKSGKKIIAGTFNRVKFKKNYKPVKEVEQPDGTKKRYIEGGTQSGSPYAYISLTDVCDKTELKLQFVSLSRNEVLFESSVILSCKDRLKTVEIVAALPPLRVPEQGVYAFEVVYSDEVIGSHRIVAQEITDQDQDQGQE